MTDAPERIWVWPDYNDHFNPVKQDWTHGFWDSTEDSLGTEYVRVDHIKAQARTSGGCVKMNWTEAYLLADMEAEEMMRAEEELIRRCDVLEILDNEGSLGRTRKLVEQLVAVTPEAQAAEIERLRGDLAKTLESLQGLLWAWNELCRAVPVLFHEPNADAARATLAALTGAQKDGN